MTVEFRYIPIEDLIDELVVRIFYAAGGAPSVQTQRLPLGTAYSEALADIADPTKDGHIFLGWYTAIEGGQPLDPDSVIEVSYTRTLYAQWAPDGVYPPEYFHARFMRGYPDGLFRPEAPITRAEVATILARGIVINARTLSSLEGIFSDVTADDWFYEYVAIAYEAGLIEGFGDGTFGPNEYITREQIAAMLARTGEVLEAGEMPFTDGVLISEWARDYVYTVYYMGWMFGDEAGTFRPSEDISRAEAAAALGRVLGRGDTTALSVAGVLTDLRIFPDASDPSQWHYFYVIEATNSHWFILNEEGVEIWTRIDN
jgi:uncharacterized repeat protein (TIGR02543 family)